MKLTATPATRTFGSWPDRAALASTLDTPLVGTARLHFSEVDGRVEARWVVPWLAVVLTLVLVFGVLTAGVVVGHVFDRLGAVGMWSMLAFIWLLLAPVATLMFWVSLKHTLRQPVHIVLDPGAQTIEVGGPNAERHVVAVDRVRAFVTVARMVRAGSASGEDAGGGRFVTRTEYSILHESQDGRFVHVPLFAIRDSGEREVELRRWMHELPRRLGWEQVRVSLDRRGERRGRADAS